MKTCKKCGLDKPLSDYTVDTRYKDGYYPWCAACRRAWRQARKAKQLALQRDWRQENLDHAREYARDYYHEHKEQIVPKRKAYDRKRWKEDAEHRKRKNEQDRERYRTSMTTRMGKQRAGMRYYHRAKSQPGFRAKRRAWDRLYRHHRRALVRAVVNTLTLQEWQDILQSQNYICLACRRPFGPELPPTMDHIVPLVKGKGLTKDNCQALCGSCNSRKHTKTIDYRPVQQSGFEWDDE